MARGGKHSCARLWAHFALRLPVATDTCCLTVLKSKLGYRTGSGGMSLGGGQGGLCSFPARNNEAVISVSPGGGLAGETVKRGLSCIR